MQVQETKINGLLIIQPQVFKDDRGWFMESFNQQKFKECLGKFGQVAPDFVQDNHSFSKKGVLRGLHYQTAPHAQGKLVRVVRGKAWDVAVDIRKSSPSYGQWVGIELSEENKKMFWIPEGFAHGFLCLEDNTQFLYKTTDFYSQESERSLLWNDPILNIEWARSAEFEVIVNDKDKNADIFII